MTFTLRHPSAVKDMMTGSFFCLLIMTVMHIMPILGIFAWVVLPLPVLFFRLKLGRGGSSIIMLVSLMVLIVMTRNFTFNVLYFGSLLMTGFFLGEFIEKHLPIEKIVLYTGLTVAGSLLAALAVYAMSQGSGIGQLIVSYVDQYQLLTEQLFADSSKLYPQMNMQPDEIKKVGSFLAMIFPGVLINSYLTMVWINILLIKRLLKKRGLSVQSLENLNHWKAPFMLIFGVIVFSIALFVVSGPLKFIAINSLTILMFIYFFQGIAVVSYFFQKKNAPFTLRLMVYVLITVQPLFLTLVIGFGLFDTWANFRKLEPAA